MNAVLVATGSVARPSGRVCAEFAVHSQRFEVVEVDPAVRSTDMIDASRPNVVAAFTIDDRQFQIRPSRQTSSSGAAASRPLAKLLTVREAQIVELVAGGLRNKQIASQLALSEYTVAAYIKQIAQKLDVRNRTAIAACWLHDAYRHPPAQALRV